LAALRVGANIIFQMWSNTYRFASEERLLSHLKKITGYRKIKGDYLKEQDAFIKDNKSDKRARLVRR